MIVPTRREPAWLNWQGRQVYRQYRDYLRDGHKYGWECEYVLEDGSHDVAAVPPESA